MIKGKLKSCFFKGFGYPLASLLVFSTLQLERCEGTEGKYGKIKWVSYDEFDPKQEVPTGIQEGYKMYTTRGAMDGIYYCGKYSPDYNKAWFGKSQQEVSVDLKSVEYLSYPRGTVSWVYTYRTALPENYIKGGIVTESRYSSPCRALHNSVLVPGKHLGNMGCIVAFDGKEYVYSEFEMAVPNLMAKVLQAEP